MISIYENDFEIANRISYIFGILYEYRTYINMKAENRNRSPSCKPKN